MGLFTKILIILSLLTLIPPIASAQNCFYIDISLSESGEKKILKQTGNELNRNDKFNYLSLPNSLLNYPIENLKNLQDVDVKSLLREPGSCINIGDLFFIDSILPGTYRLHFNTAVEMSKSLVRIEGYFEASSNNYYCEIFSYDEFKNWWVNKYGDWTFETDWTGLNFPGNILKPFQQVDSIDERCGHDNKFLNLSGLEAIFANIFYKLHGTNYYLIATNDEYSEGTIDHEVAHALFYTNSRYFESAKKTLESLWSIELPRGNQTINAFEILEKVVGPGGFDYNSSVWLDEMHAFLGSNWSELFCDANSEDLLMKSDLKLYYNAIVELQENYYQTVKEVAPELKESKFFQKNITKNLCN